MKNLLRCFALVIGLLSINVGWAADFLVTQTGGNTVISWGPKVVGADGSFAKAVEDANAAGAGPHTIKFDPSLAGQTIALSDPNVSLILTNSDVTIDGEALNITLQKSGGWGNLLDISGNNNTVQNLTFSFNANLAMAISGSNNTFANNTTTSIYFNITGGTNTLSGNTINNGIAQDVILANGATTTITKNTITYTGSNAQRYGVNIGTGINDVTVSDNTISGFHSGIYSWAPGTNCNIIGNDVSNSPNHNIFIQNGTNQVTITNNKAHDAQYSGIVVQTCQNAIIKGNRSYANGQSGKGGAGIYDVGSTNTLIDSNYIYSNLTNGIECEGGTNGLVIIRNVIGTDETETTDLGNYGNDILIKDANNITVGRPNEGNLIVYTKNKLGLSNTAITDPLTDLDNIDIQHGMGISISDLSGSKVAATNVTIQGNIIGTDRTGTSTTMGTQLSAIYAEKQANLTTNSNLVIGGTNPGEGNIVGAVMHPWRAGIQIWQVQGTKVQGNFIGTNGSGSLIPNNAVGIASNGTNNIVIEQNVVGNSSTGGIYIKGGGQIAGSSNATIKNNLVGVDASQNPLGNGEVGILIQDASSNNTIEENVIAATTGKGIWLSGENVSNNTIISNQIGNVLNSNDALENTGNGILLDNGATGNTIGQSNKGNTITNKKTAIAAIQINGSATIQNTIQGNILSCNAGKGIELSDNGNDNYASDVDPNWVTINTAEPGTDIISGKFQATTAGNVTIDIYMTGDCQTRCSSDANGTVTPNELAQGKTWVTSISVSGITGEWSYTLTAADKTAGMTKDNAIVTATDGAGNTSEFSVCEFDPPCTKPTKVDLTTSADAVCDGETITLTASATPLNSANIIEWYKNDTLMSGITTSEITISNISENGTYKVFIYDLDKNLCGAFSETKTVTINTNPSDPEFENKTPEFCSGTGNEVISVTNIDGMEYQWTADNIVSGNGTNAVTIDFSTATNPTKIKVIAVNNITSCKSSEIELDVTILDNPTPTINGNSTPLCNEQDVIYNVVNADTASKYTWTLPLGATSTGDISTNNDTISVDFTDNNGNITVTEKNAKGCIGTSENFTISLKSCGLKALFTDNLNGVLCKDSSLTNNQIEFSDLSSEPSTGQIETWAWDFGTDATPGTITGKGPHTVSYSTIGTKYITLTITDDSGTEDTYLDSIVVNDIPNQSNFTLNGVGGCQDTEGEFEVTGNNGVDLGLYDYDWTVSPSGINNGQGTTKVSTTFTTDGTASVKISDKTTTCQIGLSKAYQVTIKPNTNIDIVGAFDICDGNSQHSYFNNDSTYNYILMSGNDTINSLTDIHPEVDSVFIKWTLKDKDGKIVDLKGTQQGAFQANDNALFATIKPGFITGNDSNGDEIQFKDYTISISIEKKGACGVDSTVVDEELFTINKSHKYEFSIADQPVVCNEDSINYTAELKLDDVIVDPYTDYSSTKVNWTGFNYVHKWYHIDNDKKGNATNLFKVTEVDVNGNIPTTPVIKYYTNSSIIPASFKITDTISTEWLNLTTQDTIFVLKDDSSNTTLKPTAVTVAEYIALNPEFSLTSTVFSSQTSQYILGAEADSVILKVESEKYCYTRLSVFDDTTSNYTVRRPNGIIAIGSESSGFPTTDDLTILDVEDITLLDVSPLNSGTTKDTLNIDWEWTWKTIVNDEEVYVSDSMVSPSDVQTVHYPQAISEIMYRLVTNNGYCYDTAYKSITNLLLPFVPSVFSPNGDDTFDGWVIHNSNDYPEMVVKVFNRWGALVYESDKGYPTPWDGTRNSGEDLPIGTYFYVIEFNDQVVEDYIEDSNQENYYQTSRPKDALKAGAITIMR